MKWKQKYRFRDGDIRTRTSFLFFKKCIGRECRWLERASYEQRYTTGGMYPFWDDVRWMDD